MKSNYKSINFLPAVLGTLLFLGACKKNEYALPTAKDGLQNDAIKRTLGPNIVTQAIDFAYAAAILPGQGKLVSMEAEASIPGATGTFLEHNSYNTNGSGVDVPVLVGSPSVTTGSTSVVTFTRDTSAATLRYRYIIPEAARGQKITIKFTAKSSNGQTVSYSMGPYDVTTLDMVRLLPVSNNANAYISIADMKVYNAVDAAANAGKIDVVYLYRALTTSQFNHSFVSPGADPVYLPGVTLPAGVNRSTLLRKVFSLQDFNLAQLQFGIYIDELDFKELDMTNQPNFAINMKAESGMWAETADGKYRAYIYVNSVNAAGTAVISMKRWTVPGK